MQFIMRSLGGKLTASAALVLLFCMLLFMLASWSLLTLYSEHETSSNARLHLTLTKWAYSTRNTLLVRELEDIAGDEDMSASVSHRDAQRTQTRLRDISRALLAQYHLSLSTLEVVLPNHEVLTHVENLGATSKTSTPLPLIDQSLSGNVVAALQRSPSGASTTPAKSDEWVLCFAVPIRQANGGPSGVLLTSQPIDDAFAQELVQRLDANIVLCVSGQIQGIAGTTLKNLSHTGFTSAEKTCQPDRQTVKDGAQQYISLASTVQMEHQTADSPPLTIVDIEPTTTVNLHNQRLLLLLVGIGMFTFALGVFLYSFLTRTFFVQPLRQLQSRVRTLVAENTDAALPPQDELAMLFHSFNLLSDSLESESLAMTKQMGNILIMSDALISTLNLEHLLGEIVARLGRIMQVKHASLLLYGREMLSPWAVAQWSEDTTTPSTPAILSTNPLKESTALQQSGAVTVHADPDGDVTMAVTTKMTALPSSSSGKRQAIRSSQSPQTTPPYGLRRPRIPRPALRDLDMILAHMVIQKQKIAYGEDVATIYQERRENWARIALETGYRAVIAVPLLLQDQAIGAFMLYSDSPYQVSSRETFLLSTAAIQASMAIQNALLFAEVKEKNAALERANNLKSQFLANVTHELRSPLHSIIGYGSMIVDGFVDGELTKQQEEDIQFIVRRAEDLSHLVDDMLDLSKIEADRIEVKPEPLDLASSLTDVINQHKLMANEKELYLKLEMEESLPLVLADSHRLRQVVTNLVSNALKFTEQGGVTLRCTLNKSGDMVRVTVQDTGIGISPAALEYIFEAFRQADGSTTRRFGGTGLGLTIAKKLIELQGGEVAVESVIGQGSAFSLTLPVAASPNTPT